MQDKMIMENNDITTLSEDKDFYEDLILEQTEQM